MNIVKAVSVLSVFLAVCGLASADWIDQEQTLDDGTLQIMGFEPIGQEFTPTFSEHTGVDLWILDMNPPEPLEPLTVRVREGGLDGAILDSISLLPPEGCNDWVHFPMSFSAVPGDLYLIEADATNPRWGWVWNGSDDVYPGGIAWLFGNPEPGSDLTFRTWVVPEPATLSVLALGGLLAARRRR